MTSEEKVLIILNDGLPRTVDAIAQELRLQGELESNRIAKEGAWGLADKEQARFNQYWEVETDRGIIPIEASGVPVAPFTVEECRTQAKRLLELALQENRDRRLKHGYVKLKLAFQELAMLLEARTEKSALKLSEEQIYELGMKIFDKFLEDYGDVLDVLADR